MTPETVTEAAKLIRRLEEARAARRQMLAIDHYTGLSLNVVVKKEAWPKNWNHGTRYVAEFLNDHVSGMTEEQLAGAIIVQILNGNHTVIADTKRSLRNLGITIENDPVDTESKAFPVTAKTKND